MGGRGVQWLIGGAVGAVPGVCFKTCTVSLPDVTTAQVTSNVVSLF